MRFNVRRVAEAQLGGMDGVMTRSLSHAAYPARAAPSRPHGEELAGAKRRQASRTRGGRPILRDASLRDAPQDEADIDFRKRLIRTAARATTPSSPSRAR